MYIKVMYLWIYVVLLKYCTYCLLNFAKILEFGEPSTECILASWSISFAPGNNGFDLEWKMCYRIVDLDRNQKTEH